MFKYLKTSGRAD